MADLSLDANTFGSFSISAGNNCEDDTVTVNVGSGFFGTINVDSSNNDGEIETVSLNLPAGWSVNLFGETSDTFESPTWVQHAYIIVRDDGSQAGLLQIRSNDAAPICFVQGTEIQTPQGPRPVESLKVGDDVLTIDGKRKPIRWIGSRRLQTPRLIKDASLRPVRISANPLGQGIPSRDLCVSRQHRIQLSNRVARRMFGTKNVLVAAHRLTAFPGIDEFVPQGDAVYFHILLDDHDVIMANGTPAETLYLGQEAQKALDPMARAEIKALFPDLFECRDEASLSRHVIPKNQQQKSLCQRLAKRQRIAIETLSLTQ